jgi:hypothetical protein
MNKFLITFGTFIVGYTVGCAMIKDEKGHGAIHGLVFAVGVSCIVLGTLL